MARQQRTGCGCQTVLLVLGGIIATFVVLFVSCGILAAFVEDSANPKASREKAADVESALENAKFERVGYHRNDTRRWFTYYVGNATEEDIRRFCEKEKQQPGNARLLWIDFFNDRQHTPDVTLTGELPDSCFPYQVASYRYNPFNNNEVLNFHETSGQHEADGKVLRLFLPRGLRRPPPPRNYYAFRTWTDNTGKFNIEAKYWSYGDGKVTLKKKDGSKVSILWEHLSSEDQEWLKQMGRGESDS